MRPTLLHLFVTFLTCIVSGGSTGWPIPTQEGAGGAECHRINVTQMALTWPDPVTSIGFRQPQRPGRLVSLPVPQSSLLCTDRVSVICLFLAPGQGAGDIVTINSVTRWAAV